MHTRTLSNSVGPDELNQLLFAALQDLLARCESSPGSLETDGEGIALDIFHKHQHVHCI